MLKELLCSVCIPTRKRPEKLLATIDSIKSEAVGNDYEILVRCDFDDAETLAALPQLIERQVICVIGPRLDGYRSIDKHFATQLANAGRGKWCWIMGDDAKVTGPWDERLADIPLDNHIVQPEISKLGGSTYERAVAQAFPIVPNQCWRKFKQDCIPAPGDTGLHELLVVQHGWTTWFLTGITFWHQRDTEENIAEHRKFT